MTEAHVLWHYSTVEGGLEIVRGRQIRATSLAFLNDRTEGVLVADLLRNHLRGWANKHPGRGAKGHIDKIADRIANTPPDIFVACFSDLGDRLDSWRAYASGGSGVALGYSQAALANRLLSNSRLDRVHYLSPGDRNVLSEFTQNELDGVSSWVDDDVPPIFTSADADRIAEQIDWRLRVVGPFWKHAAFREESEWRIAITPTEDLVNRIVRASRLIPFTLISLAPEALVTIRLGPGPSGRPEDVRELEREFRRLSDNPTLEVLPSDVPLRAIV